MYMESINTDIKKSSGFCRSIFIENSVKEILVFASAHLNVLK